MKRNLLVLLVITALMMITCGNEPPPDFYEGTPEDSAAIITELNAHADFLKSSDICIPQNCAVTVEDVFWPLTDQFYKADDPIIKQHIDSLADALSDTVRFQDLWFAKDTTCTVYLFDTFTVIPQYHWDVRYTGHYDKDSITPGGDTLHMLGTIDTNTAGGPDEMIPVYGEGLRHLFLEPVRELVVADGETTYQFVEPREWTLKRVSYGNYFFPSEGAGYPVIAEIKLTHAGGRVDTIHDYVTDTTFTGHAMNRLKSIDSLMTFTNGETLQVSMTLGGVEPTDSMTLFFTSGNGVRTQMPDGDGDFIITGSGVVNLIFLVILKESYYYVIPAKDYLAMIWLIPVIVQ